MTRALRVAVLDYEAGNVRSARRAFEQIGTHASITATPDDARRADVLVIPGVGHFASCLRALNASGLQDVISDWIRRQRPVFGICVGMQLLYRHSQEGDTEGLGLLPGRVVRFAQDSVVPHLGWDVVNPAAHLPGQAGANDVVQDPLLAGVAGRHFYFTHSYYAVPDDADHVVATCTYGGTAFPCLVREGSVVGTQFHPEKSGQVGIRLLQNWIDSLKKA